MTYDIPSKKYYVMPFHRKQLNWRFLFFHRAAGRRKSKDKKFGFGGKKKGQKSNTSSSANDISDYRPGKKGRPGQAAKAKGGRGQNMGTKLKAKRMGKNRRKNVAGRKKWKETSMYRK